MSPLPAAARAHRLATVVATAGARGAGLCLAGIVGVGMLQVFCRYVLNRPLVWPEEVSRLLLVWLTYLGALALPEAGRHVAVSVLYDRMPPSLRRGADVLADLLGIAFFAALAVGGLGLVVVVRGVLLPALQLPLNLICGLVPIIAVLQVYLHAVTLVRRLGGRPRAAAGDH